jgi:hypothetical protein
MSTTTASWIGLGVAAFVAVNVWLNLKGRKKERRLQRIRGAQDAKAFAAMFAAEPERLVAENLYPRLQSITYTHALPLAKDDTFPALHFDPEDLLDEVRGVFADLGCNKPNSTELTQGLAGVETIGELVVALAKLTSAETTSSNSTER